MMEFTKSVEDEYKVKITYSVEDTPLGTAGPLTLARAQLETDSEPFFMLNSDVACEFPLKKMLQFHRSHKREGTILVTPVEDPSKYGLVVSNEDGMILQFLEKPDSNTKTFPTNHINAGIYLLNKEVLKRLPSIPTNISIERKIFPEMVISNDLYAMRLDGYWMDIGQPLDFIKGTKHHLHFLRKTDTQALADSTTDYTVHGNVMIDPTAKIGKGSVLGPDVVIGPNSVIGEGVRITNSTIMAGTKIASYARIGNSIIGWSCNIKAWAHLDKCQLGEDVEVATETVLVGAIVCPHKGMKDSSFTTQVFM